MNKQILSPGRVSILIAAVIMFCNLLMASQPAYESGVGWGIAQQWFGAVALAGLFFAARIQQALDVNTSTQSLSQATWGKSAIEVVVCGTFQWLTLPEFLRWEI